MITMQDYADDNNDADIIGWMTDTTVTAPDNYKAFDTVTVVVGDSSVTVDVNKEVHDTVWRMYRYAPMNCRDSEKYINRWKQRFSDIMSNVATRYNVLFKAYETYRLTGQLESIDSETVVTVNGGTTSNGNDSNTVTAEAIPQTADASDRTWLTGRNKSAGTNSNTVQNYSNAVARGINGYTVSELVSRIRDNNWSPYEDIAGEVRDLYIPFYIDECGCGCYGCD